VADSEDQAEENEGFATDEGDAPAFVPEPVVAPPARRRLVKGRKSGPLLPWQEWEAANDKWLEERRAAGGDGEDPESGTVTAAEPVPAADPAPEVLLPLLRFQKEWLAWALTQEASASRGGILADEMGMGKTIQAISLVLTARHLRPPDQRASSSSSLPSLGPSMRQVGCTLVVCPVVAVIQWAQEIERHTVKGSVRHLIYHGPRRADHKFDFDSYDFVITTYSTIEADYRKNIMPPKIRCHYCDKLFYPDKMKVHLKYYCGPDAMRTEKQAKQQGKKWGASKVKGKSKGRKKEDDKEAKDSEESGDELCSQPRGQSPLHSVRWERVILDEVIPVLVVLHFNVFETDYNSD
jgi:DNA repair protein RAD16